LERKVELGVTLGLVFMSLVMLAFEVHLTAAEPRTIIVPDDYPIIQLAVDAASPEDTVYVRAGTYYEHIVVGKTLSIAGENKSTTIIDGSGTGTVVNIQANNVTISNFTIKNAANAGVLIYRYSKYNTISGNLITSINNYGIILDYMSSDNTISNNTITNNLGFAGGGISMGTHSDKNTFTGNLIVNNTRGIEIEASSGNYFRNNQIVGNGFNLYVGGFFDLSSYIHDIDSSNTVNDKPIYYWVDKHDMQVPADAGYVGVVKSTNITVRDLNLANNGQGVLLAWTNNSLITGINASRNVYAISVHSSSRNAIVGNNLSNNNNGMEIDGSSQFNYVVGNTFALNNAHGIKVWLQAVGDNVFHHNNFVDNKYQATVVTYPSSWDNGYPSGGNYWSDYAGVDQYSGPYQNETGSDGIGDTPYIVNPDPWHYNIDQYPLMESYVWDSRNTEISKATASKTVIGQGYTLQINVTVFNYGIFDEASNITVYANSTIIETKQATLTRANPTTITFTWNTTSFAKGNYTITAYTAPVPDETNTADNTLTAGLITVSHPGDVDGDMKVDGKDIAILAKAFGTRRGQPGYATNADVNNDERIDGKDIAVAAKNFGTRDP
jgi:parallel beta-helix repeat protein